MDLLKHRDPVTDPHTGRHLWTFPNGKTVSVIPDPHAPLRWEILVGVGVTEVQAGLTGPQVEARLAEIAAQPKER